MSVLVRAGRRIDRLTAALIAPLLAAFTLPLLTYRPNRIAPPEVRSLTEIFGHAPAVALMVIALMMTAILLVSRRAGLRAVLLAVALLGYVVLLGIGAELMLDQALPAARAAPGAGFWLGLGVLALLLTDSIIRLQPGGGARAILLFGTVIAVFLLLRSGALSDLSISAEYRNRAAPFRQAAQDHIVLAFGSFLAAFLVGLPVGIMVQRRPALRDPVLNLLTLIQTIPSIALFGMLILPLAWVAANIPGAAALGIQGIGMAPAFVALFLYSLLPIVANTIAGLAASPPDITEAARGCGMTALQQLRMVNLPLALPMILAGARIVLVQNIGLATVGALIGSGGFGIFIFQGIGQTATDLILLGVLPVVGLAFLTSALLDLLVALTRGATP